MPPKPRVSVAQAQRPVYRESRLSPEGKAAAQRDSRLGRKLVFSVLGGTILLFGSNFAGLWETPGQSEARKEVLRASGRTKPADDQKRVALEQQEADRQRTERLIRERDAQRKAADDDAARRAGDDAARKKALDEGRTPPPPMRPNLAETDCQMTKPIEAIVAACSEIIARFNDFADAYFVRGWALRERNQPERALTDFNRAVELSPKRAAAYSQRALTRVRLKDFDRAIADYNTAIELDPRSSSFVNDRGVAYMDLKDYARAIADFDQAIVLDARYPLPYNNRARAHVLGNNDHVRAIADLDRAIELNPRYGLAYENRAFSHLDTKDLSKAIADFSKSIDLNPRSARALNGRGVAYERQGSRELAITDYRRALDADQSYATARQNLTRLGEKP